MTMLAFEDFAHFYADSGMSEAHSREHFAVFSDILECIARYFWVSDRDTANMLGISLGGDSPALVNAIESIGALRPHFNDAAEGGAESEQS